MTRTWIVRLGLLTLLAQPVAAQNGIRGIDMRTELIRLHGLERFCEPERALRLDTVEYADLTGDGREEAVVRGLSCLAGTGGADVVGVVALDGDRPVMLPMADEGAGLSSPELFVGAAYTPGLAVQEGRLVRYYTMFPKDWDGRHERRGWTRTILYRWDGDGFVVSDVRDTPPPSDRL